jgi:hypothetical protein
MHIHCANDFQAFATSQPNPRQRDVCVMSDLETCKLLFTRLQRRDTVAVPELKRALGKEHWMKYQMLRDWAKEQRAQAKIASHELRGYVNMLRIADLRQAQADRMRARTGKLMPRGKRPCDLYEQALQNLSDLIEWKPSLWKYFDRPFHPKRWSSSSDISPDKEGVPRLWFHSTNAMPQGAEREIKTVREIKMEVLQGAISAHQSRS